jgi:hypothetical protein
MGLFGSALLAAGGVGLGVWPTRRLHSPRKPLSVVEADRFAVLAAVAARVVTAPGADPVGIAHGVDAALAHQSLEAGRDFNRLLALIESGLTGLLLDGRPRPFTHLDGTAQDAALLAFRDSRFVLRRAGYHSIRKLCAAAHYALESSWAEIGYPGPPSIPAGFTVEPPAAPPASANGGDAEKAAP